MHIHVWSLHESLKKRKWKDGQYNEQYKKGNQKTAVHRTMQQKKDAATETQTPLKTRDDCICFF